MLDKVLERSKYKKPPFYNENNSSDKGFKDTIILLTIIDFIIFFGDDAIFYFITSEFDYYGNLQDERRFEISNYINNEKTEKFLQLKNKCLTMMRKCYIIAKNK